ncbi:hypothetical protein EWM62_17180 [Mucilaginibacter terrigena]|uniref:Carboxypeptidase-like regulatory domain-containing protein n=1 Tax=Mucilaginibacter terrigena TaxID=2492395 RepID=A0A4Q5LJF0_9SPHI|nr:hypothetical protein [Mucilaginibacter terrigena]RYU86884.1 hypothetical protein EWM62_17180 [Mucilaginibacter terrigena]
MPLKFVIACIINLFCFTFLVSAQQTVIKGAIYKRISSVKLTEVLVTNMRTKGVTECDGLGNFSISANVGDTLLFTKRDYTPQKQEATNYGMIVYMQPEVRLNEVRVIGQTKKQELTEIMGDYRKQGTFYNGNPPALSMLVSPLTGIYELFGKTPGRAKRFAAFSKRELEASAVDRRYNKPLVMRVTGVTDSVTVQKFMEYYRPSYEDLKTWNDYDLIQKVKTQYEYFKKNGDKDGLQKLY